jgi:hypothetical protein
VVESVEIVSIRRKMIHFIRLIAIKS